jgi:hypothetical protein
LSKKYFGGLLSFQIDLRNRIYTQAFWNHLFHMINNKYKQLFRLQYFNMGTAVVNTIWKVFDQQFFLSYQIQNKIKTQIDIHKIQTIRSK